MINYLKESLTLPDLNLNNNTEFSTNDVALIMFTSGSTGEFEEDSFPSIELLYFNKNN